MLNQYSHLPPYYEYDADDEVMIRIPRDIDKLPMIFYRSEMRWRGFEPQDELFDRAIYLGQGCWERLRTIEEGEALQILEEWGYRSAQ